MVYQVTGWRKTREVSEILHRIQFDCVRQCHCWVYSKVWFHKTANWTDMWNVPTVTWLIRKFPRLSCRIQLSPWEQCLGDGHCVAQYVAPQPWLWSCCQAKVSKMMTRTTVLLNWHKKAAISFALSKPFIGSVCLQVSCIHADTKGPINCANVRCYYFVPIAYISLLVSLFV